MKITPLEIRQKVFEKNFRGYDKDEVNAFLLTLSQEWERISDENKELRIKLEATEREVMKLREVESSLFKTLKTAEDTGANVIEQARQTAELHLRESQMKAEAILNEAKTKAKDTIEESELRAREVVVEMEERLKSMIENYKKLESAREDLLLELKRVSQDTLERVERIKNNQRSFDPDQHLSQGKKDIKKVVFPNQHHEPVSLPKNDEELIQSIEREAVVFEQTLVMETQTRKTSKSFFDDIE